MAFRIQERTETTLSEINVTPLVDVMLVLLIVFMVTAPMLSASVEVDLAQATATPADAKEHVVISVTADDPPRIFVADELTILERLAEKTREAQSRTAIRDVAIRCDRRVPFGVVLEVLDRLNGAGIRDVGLVMDPPASGGSASPAASPAPGRPARTR